MKKIPLPLWLKLDRNYTRVFYSLILLFGIYVLPILLADRYYQDDLSRSLRGVTGWTSDARPLTEWIMKWLCGGTPIGDIAPLPLLMSILILAYTLTLYLRQNLPDVHSVWILSVIGFLVIANPFFLSNLSYRYDCVTMVLSLCAAIIPYALPSGTNIRKMGCFSFLMCMVILTSYQPCCGMYIALGCLELFFMILAADIDWIRLVMRAVSLGTGALIYYFIIMPHYIADGGWQQSAYQVSLDSSAGLLDSVRQNFDRFLYLMKLYLPGVPMPVILSALLLMAGGMLVAVMTIRRTCGRFRYLGALYTLFLPVLITAGSILPLLVLTPSIFSMSAHTLIVLCGFCLWAGIMIYFIASRAEKLTIILLIPCLLFSLTFSYTYGNAMKSQKQYDEYITYGIVRDIEAMNTNGQYHRLTIDGKMLRSKENAMLCEKYPLFQHIIPMYISNSSYLGGAQLLHYMRYDLEFDSLSEQEALAIEQDTPVLTNAVYSCYTYEDKIIIHFNEESE